MEEKDSPKPMDEWPPSEVAAWVRGLSPKLDSYATAFEQNGIDGATLIADMTELYWAQMIPDANVRRFIQFSRDQELARLSTSSDDDEFEAELLHRIRSAAPLGSSITLNVGALGRGARQININCCGCDFNPSRLAPYAVAVLGGGVFLSLLAAWD